jgi:hypothetical protein
LVYWRMRMAEVRIRVLLFALIGPGGGHQLHVSCVWPNPRTLSSLPRLDLTSCLRPTCAPLATVQRHYGAAEDHCVSAAIGSCGDDAVG